jgi:hypothetical protein
MTVVDPFIPLRDWRSALYRGDPAVIDRFLDAIDTTLWTSTLNTSTCAFLGVAHRSTQRRIGIYRAVHNCMPTSNPAARTFFRDKPFGESVEGLFA